MSLLGISTGVYIGVYTVYVGGYKPIRDKGSLDQRVTTKVITL